MSARRIAARSCATWLTAWVLALAIASTIALLSAADGQQPPDAMFDSCAAGAACSR